MSEFTLLQHFDMTEIRLLKISLFITKITENKTNG